MDYSMSPYNFSNLFLLACRDGADIIIIIIIILNLQLSKPRRIYLKYLTLSHMALS